MQQSSIQHVWPKWRQGHLLAPAEADTGGNMFNRPMETTLASCVTIQSREHALRSRRRI